LLYGKLGYPGEIGYGPGGNTPPPGGGGNSSPLGGDGNIPPGGGIIPPICDDGTIPPTCGDGIIPPTFGSVNIPPICGDAIIPPPDGDVPIGSATQTDAVSAVSSGSSRRILFFCISQGSPFYFITLLLVVHCNEDSYKPTSRFSIENVKYHK
jgi:hypothetical protein